MSGLIDSTADLPVALREPVAELLDRLGALEAEHGPLTFANSLGAEDMVLTDLIARHRPGITVFSLDTGRLPEATYALMDKVREHYGLDLQVFYPEREALETLVRDQGVNGFYHSPEQRQRCCKVRKVEPLQRALAGYGGWLTGLRRDQAVTRHTLVHVEWDDGHGLWKINPLLDWSLEMIWDYIAAREVPYNALHDEGYPSIGCAPCTRPVAAGEDIRAGRWWWEQPEQKECGLHPAQPSRSSGEQ